jgi:hypothetical protein
MLVKGRHAAIRIGPVPLAANPALPIVYHAGFAGRHSIAWRRAPVLGYLLAYSAGIVPGGRP